MKMAPAYIANVEFFHIEEGQGQLLLREWLLLTACITRRQYVALYSASLLFSPVRLARNLYKHYWDVVDTIIWVLDC